MAKCPILYCGICPFCPLCLTAELKNEDHNPQMQIPTNALSIILSLERITTLICRLDIVIGILRLL